MTRTATPMTADRSKGPAVLAAAGFGIIVVFEVGLAVGAPFGAAAWGGEHASLLS
jgi:hypothetical protein